MLVETKTKVKGKGKSKNPEINQVKKENVELRKTIFTLNENLTKLIEKYAGSDI